MKILLLNPITQEVIQTIAFAQPVEKDLLRGGADDFDDWVNSDNTEIVDLQRAQGKTVNSEIAIYHDDTLFDLKEKLFVATNIPIYRQHLFYRERNFPTIHRSDYDIFFSDNKVAINEENDDTEMGGILVDHAFCEKSVYISFKTYETIRILGDRYEEQFYLYDLADYVGAIGANFLLSEEYQRGLFFRGIVRKYFPVVDMSMFITYLKDDSKLFLQFPMMNKPKAELKKKFAYQQAIQNRFNKEYRYFERFDKKLEYLFKRVIIRTSPQEHGSVNVKNILDCIPCSAEIPYIKGIVHHNEKIYKIVKYYVNSRVKLEDDEETAAEYVTLMFKDGDTNSTITFYPDCSYKVDIVGVNRPSSLEDVVANYEKRINSILKKATSERVFKLENTRFKQFKFDNIVIEKFDVDIVWYHKLSQARFDKIASLIDEYCQYELFSQRDNRYAKTATNYLLKIHRGASRPTERFLLKKNIEVQDYFCILREEDKRKIWEHRFKGAKMDITKGVTNVKMSLSINHESFIYCKRYLLSFMKDIEAIPESKQTKKLSDDVKKKCVELDEQLWNFSINGKRCSRICQKEFRPIAVYTDEEYLNLSKEEKKNTHLFPSYTTGDDLWYKCPTHMPLLGFIAEKHPLGYCIPKCKKVNTDGEKNKLVMAKCMKERKVKKGEFIDVTVSTNVIKFGKLLDINRKQYLHEDLYVIMGADKAKLNMTRIVKDGLSYEMQFLTNYASFKDIQVKRLIEDIHEKFTPKIYSSLTMEGLLSYEILKAEIKRIHIQNSVSWKNIIASIIYYIYGDIIITFETKVLVENEILTRDNSKMSMIIDRNVDTSTLPADKTMLMVELRDNLFLVSGTTQKYLDNLATFKNNEDKKRMINFATYSVIEKSTTVVERFLFGNRILFAICEFEGSLIALGVHNSFIRSSDKKTKTSTRIFNASEYDLPPASVVKYCKERAKKFDPIFLCQGDIGKIVTKSDSDKCTFVGFRLNNEYFWFNPCSYEEVKTFVEDIKIEFVDKNIHKVNQAIIKGETADDSIFSGNSELYYKMNIYTIFRKEMLRVLSLYKSDTVKKKIAKYVKIYKTTYTIPPDVEIDFPYSHKTITRLITTKASFADYTFKEDFVVLANQLKNAQPLITSIAKQLCSGKNIPLNNMENITTSELTYKATFTYDKDIPKRVDITHLKSKYSTKKGLFYNCGKINISGEILQSMIDNFYAETQSTSYFLARISDFSIYIIDNYFSFDVHGDEKITIECL